MAGRKKGRGSGLGTAGRPAMARKIKSVFGRSEESVVWGKHPLKPAKRVKKTLPSPAEGSHGPICCDLQIWELSFLKECRRKSIERGIKRRSESFSDRPIPIPIIWGGNKLKITQKNPETRPFPPGRSRDVHLDPTPFFSRGTWRGRSPTPRAIQIRQPAGKWPGRIASAHSPSGSRVHREPGRNRIAPCFSTQPKESP